MSEKKEPEKTHDKPEEKEHKVSIATGDSNATALTRSGAEQSIIDTLGTDPSKYKEGTREHELVMSLPENIAKKQKEEKEKEGK